MLLRLPQALEKLRGPGAPVLVVLTADPGRRRQAETDPWLAREALKAIVEHLLPDAADREMGLVRLDASDKDFHLEGVAEEMRAGAFFGEGKVVAVQRWSPGKLTKAQVEPLRARGVWAPGNTLVLQAKHNLSATLKKQLAGEDVLLVDVGVPRGAALLRVLESMAVRRGVTLDSEAATALLELTGPILPVLWMEIAKLSDFVGRGGHIDAKAVAAVCAETREHDIFALVDAIAARNAPTALGELEHLLDQQVAPLQIVALLGAQIRRLLALRAGLDAGLSLRDAASAAHLPEWIARRSEGTARRMPQPLLRRSVATLRRADEELKRRRTPARLVFESHVLRLLGR